MSANHQRSLEAAKAKNGGDLPSDLYNLTNAQLGKLLFDLTGDKKYNAPSRTPKEDLVTLVQKLSGAEPSEPPEPKKVKRKAAEPVVASSSGETSAQPTKKAGPRGYLASLTETQIAQMKHILTITPEQLQTMRHEHELKPLWIAAGETAKYPSMSGKEAVLERLKTFSEHNLKFHGII